MPGPTKQAPPPLQVDTARVVLAGTALWAIALVVLLILPACSPPSGSSRGRRGVREWVFDHTGEEGILSQVRGAGQLAATYYIPSRKPLLTSQLPTQASTPMV